jgi:pyrroloquinoline-quinone synthase
MDRAAISARLDEATEQHRLLDHPFYKAWAAGTLTREDLAFYSTQYWRQVEAFPGYLEAVAERLPDRAREIVEANLRDERDDDHPGLWIDFAEALGVAGEAVRSTAVEAETTECVASFAEAAASMSPAFALGMLYAYESQTPEVAKTKVEGLRSHYGIDGAPLAYFELHGELDVHHSSELSVALNDVIEDESDVDDAVAGARAGARAIYGLLDGVARVRQIC